MQTDNQHVDQINLISIECIQLQERINEIEEERGQEQSLRFKERAELNSQLSAVKDELNKIKSEIKPVNKSNPTSAGVTFQMMSMSSPEDSPISSYEDSPMSSPEGSSMSSPENSEVICFCGRLAKLRLSMTSKNPNRYFYNCPKRRNNVSLFFPVPFFFFNKPALLFYTCILIKFCFVWLAAMWFLPMVWWTNSNRRSTRGWDESH